MYKKSLLYSNFKVQICMHQSLYVGTIFCVRLEQEQNLLTRTYPSLNCLPVSQTSLQFGVKHQLKKLSIVQDTIIPQERAANAINAATLGPGIAVATVEFEPNVFVVK